VSVSARRATVYIVSPWYGTFAGGGGAMASAVASMLHRCRIPVVVLSTCSRSPYENWWNSSFSPGESTIQGVRIIRFPVSATDPAPYHLAVRHRLEAKEVGDELQEAFFERGLNSDELIDYVGAISMESKVIAGPYFQSLVPTLVNRFPGRIDVLPAFHDEPEFRWKPISRLVSNARQLLFLTEEEKALAIRVHGNAGGRNLVESPVVGLGVEVPAELSDDRALTDARSAARKRLDVEAGYFLYVGRIEEGKGLAYLIPWFSRWWQHRVRTGQAAPPLVLAGAGTQTLIPESPAFRYAGFLSDREKFGLMAGAIGLINPSRYESFSYVIMESWLAGRPVIVPAECAVTSGHCKRAEGGFVFQSEEQLGRCLEGLLDDSLANELGANGSRYVRRNYSWPDVADRILCALDL
jgi:glycosyltransferase involved in cell wall biosynthesis